MVYSRNMKNKTASVKRNGSKVAVAARPVSNAVRLERILTTIKSITGRLSRSHHELRHCARCGKALTDAASWERGIGPVCAAKDTGLFAKTIAQAPAMVSACVLSINPENLPVEAREVWGDLKEVIIDKMIGMMEHADGSGLSMSGEDCRLVAKVIDWMLSFRMEAVTKAQLINTIKYMGFVGLAGVLAGKASTGEAKIEFVNGRLSLVGASNKLGFLEMKKIPGVTLPRYRGSREPFTVPAKEAQRFFDVALEFWPMFEGSISDLQAMCSEWVAANPERVEVRGNYSDKPLATVKRRSDDFSVNFKWVRGVSERIVNEIKGQIPPSDRKYDPASYTWFFKHEQKDKVLALLNETYVVETNESTEQTPAGFFNRSAAPARNGYYGGGYRRNWYRG